MRIPTEVLQDALSLPINDRAALIDSLIKSLDTGADESADETWQVEITRRIQEVDTGSIHMVEWGDVEARLRARLNRP